MPEKLNKHQIETPRYDLYTKELLPYKTKEFYFNSLYCNRRNLIAHFKEISNEEKIKITKDILNNRIKVKNIAYAPSTTELKSIICPSVLFLQKFNIDYNAICKEVGLKTKYAYENTCLKKIKLSNSIIIDSREQQCLIFDEKVKTEVKCLKAGDYCIDVDITNKLVVERKSLPDLIGSISKGFERLHKEFNRAQELNANVLILVESEYSQALGFNYLPHIHAKASPEFIFSRIRELCQNYTNIQFAFVNGRKKASDLTIFSTSYGKDLFKFDIQHLIDKKVL